MPDKERISGKIAAVLTDATVMINRGREHGVTQEMTFGIWFELSGIPDPDNPSTPLPGPRFRKAILRVLAVGAKAAVCKILPGTSMREALYSDLMTSPPVRSPLVKEEDWEIRVGDRVLEQREQEKPGPAEPAPF